MRTMLLARASFISCSSWLIWINCRHTDLRLRFFQYRWSVLGAGRNQMPIAAMSVAMGGNVRVGLEDSLWGGPGRLAKSNAEQVTMARKLIEGLGLEIASPDEAREILSLKGGDKVITDGGLRVVPSSKVTFRAVVTRPAGGKGARGARGARGKAKD